MKKQIIFSLLGMVLLLGSAIAGGVLLAERETTLSNVDKDVLISKGITAVNVSDLTCEDYNCKFTISKTKAFTINKQVRNLKYLCNSTIVNKQPELKCTFVSKTETELVKERDALVDRTLGDMAKTQPKAPINKIGTPELVVITKVKA